MNRICHHGSAALIVFCIANLSAAQSLGDRARELREKKGQPAAKRVITNEDLAKPASIADADEPASGEAKPATPDEGKPSSGAAAAPSTDMPEDRAKLEDEYRTRASDTKKEIAQLERELDVLQRENKLRAAAFYADAGARLRDEAAFAAEDRRYQSEIEAKQSALNQARQKYEDLKEQARKAGLPSRVTE